MSTNKPRISTNTKLIYPELSYQTMGILFDVHNELGNKYQEKHYQRAIEIKLKSLGVTYDREVMTKIKFKNEDLGKFFIDFVIDNKLILETKKIWRISDDEIRQVLRYLESTGLKLGIIANFSHRDLEYRRVVY